LGDDRQSCRLIGARVARLDTGKQDRDWQSQDRVLPAVSGAGAARRPRFRALVLHRALAGAQPADRGARQEPRALILARFAGNDCGHGEAQALDAAYEVASQPLRWSFRQRRDDDLVEVPVVHRVMDGGEGAGRQRGR